MSIFSGRKPETAADVPPPLQLVIDGVACKQLRNRDLDKKGKADGGASDPFIRLRLVQPVGTLRKEKELARAETPHISNEANPSWPTHRLVVPLPPGGVKLDKKTGNLVVSAALLLEVFDHEDANSPQSLGRLEPKRMAELLKNPVKLGPTGASISVLVENHLLSGKSTEVTAKVSAISFSWHLELQSEEDTRRAAALAPAASAASEAETDPRSDQSQSQQGASSSADGAGPSSAVTFPPFSAPGVTAAAAAGAPALETPRTRASRRAPRPEPPAAESPAQANPTKPQIDVDVVTAAAATATAVDTLRAPAAAQQQAQQAQTAPQAQAAVGTSKAEREAAAATAIQSQTRGRASRSQAQPQAVPPTAAPAAAAIAVAQPTKPQPQQQVQSSGGGAAPADSSAATVSIQSQPQQAQQSQTARRQPQTAPQAQTAQQAQQPQTAQAAPQAQAAVGASKAEREAAAATAIQSQTRGRASRTKALPAAALPAAAAAAAPILPAAAVADPLLAAVAAQSQQTQQQAQKEEQNEQNGEAATTATAAAAASALVVPTATAAATAAATSSEAGRKALPTVAASAAAAPIVPTVTTAAASAAVSNAAAAREEEQEAERKAAVAIQSRARAVRSRESVGSKRVAQSGAFSRAAKEAEAEERLEAAADEAAQLEEAAMRIQAKQRAKNASNDVAQRRLAEAIRERGGGLDESYAESESPSEIDARGLAEDQLQAATTIQSQIRGSTARAGVAQTQLAEKHGLRFKPREYDSASEMGSTVGTPLSTPLNTPRRAERLAASGPLPNSARQARPSAYDARVEALRREAEADTAAEQRAGGSGAVFRNKRNDRSKADDGYAADGDVLEPTWQAGPQDKAALAIQARVRGNSTRKDLELHPTAGGSRTGGIPAETAAEVATRKQMAVFEAEAAQRETAAGSLQRAERARAAKRVATRKDTDAKAQQAAAAARVQAAARGSTSRKTTASALEVKRASEKRVAEAKQRSDAATSIATAYRGKTLSKEAQAERSKRALEKAERLKVEAAAVKFAGKKAKLEAAKLEAQNRLRRDAAARYIQRATRRWLSNKRRGAATRIQKKYRGKRARLESVGLRALFVAALEGQLPRGVSEMSAGPFAELIDAQLMDADASKRRASTAEDFDSAKRAKAHIDSVDNLLEQLDAREKSLADAVRAQDYGAALSIKSEIDALRLHACCELATYRGRPVYTKQPAVKPPPTPVASFAQTLPPPATVAEAAVVVSVAVMPLASSLEGSSDAALAGLFRREGSAGGGLAALTREAKAREAVEAEAKATLAVSDVPPQVGSAPVVTADVTAGIGGDVTAGYGGDARLALADLPLPIAASRRGGAEAEATRLVRAVFGEAAALYLASSKPALRKAALEQATNELSNPGKGNATVQRARGVSVLRAGAAMLEVALSSADAEVGAAARNLLITLLKATAAHADSHNARLLPALLVPPLLETIARAIPAHSGDQQSLPSLADPAATRARAEALKTLFAMCEAEHVGSGRVASALFDAHATARGAAPAEPDALRTLEPSGAERSALAALTALREISLRFGGFKSTADARRPPTLAIARFAAKQHLAASSDAGAKGGAGSAIAVQASAVQLALAVRDIDSTAVESVLRAIPATLLLHAMQLAGGALGLKSGANTARAEERGQLPDGARAAASAAARLRELKAAEGSLSKTLLTLRTAARREETRAAAAEKVAGIVTGIGALGGAETAGAHLKSVTLDKLRAELRVSRAKLDQLGARKRTLETQRRKVRPADLRTLARARELEAEHFLKEDAEVKAALSERRSGAIPLAGNKLLDPAKLALKLESLASVRADAIAQRKNAQAQLQAATDAVRALETNARAFASAASQPPRSAWHAGSESSAGAEAEAWLAALRDRARLREAQRRFDAEEAGALSDRLRSRIAAKSDRLRELHAQRERYTELLAAERAAASAGLIRTAQPIVHNSDAPSAWVEDGGGVGNSFSNVNVTTVPAPRDSYGNVSAKPESRYVTDRPSSQPPGARAAARAERAATEASTQPPGTAPSSGRAPRTPQQQPQEQKPSTSASKAAASTQGVAAQQQPQQQQEKSSTQGVVAQQQGKSSEKTSGASSKASASAAAAAKARVVADAAGAHGDTLLFKLHSFALAKPAKAGVFSRAAQPSSLAGQTVKFGIQTELAPAKEFLTLSQPVKIPEDGSEVAVALSISIDTKLNSAGLITLRRALSNAKADEDVQAEVTFVVYGTTPEQEELCYFTLDLARNLNSDLARVWVSAGVAASPSQKVAKFNVSVQAVAPLQRARGR